MKIVYADGSYSIRLVQKHGIDTYAGYEDEEELFCRWSLDGAMNTLKRMTLKKTTPTIQDCQMLEMLNDIEVKALLKGIKELRMKITDGSVSMLENYNNLIDCLLHIMFMRYDK